MWNWQQKQPSEVFYEKDAHENFALFTGKYLCWNLFLIKLQAFSLATSLKIESNIGIFL